MKLHIPLDLRRVLCNASVGISLGAAFAASSASARELSVGAGDTYQCPDKVQARYDAIKVAPGAVLSTPESSGYWLIVSNPDASTIDGYILNNYGVELTDRLVTSSARTDPFYITSSGVGQYRLSSCDGSDEFQVYSLHVVGSHTGATNTIVNTQGAMTIAGYGSLDSGTTLRAGGNISFGNMWYSVLNGATLDMNGYTLTDDSNCLQLKTGAILKEAKGDVKIKTYSDFVWSPDEPAPAEIIVYVAYTDAEGVLTCTVMDEQKGAYTLEDEGKHPLNNLAVSEGTATLRDSALATLTVQNGSTVIAGHEDGLELSTSLEVREGSVLDMAGQNRDLRAGSVTLDGEIRNLAGAVVFGDNGSIFNLNVMGDTDAGSTGLTLSQDEQGCFTVSNASTLGLVVYTGTMTLLDAKVESLTVSDDAAIVYAGNAEGLSADSIAIGGTLDMGGKALDAHTLRFHDSGHLLNTTEESLTVLDASGDTSLAFEQNNATLNIDKETTGSVGIYTLSEAGEGTPANTLAITDGAVRLADNALASLSIDSDADVSMADGMSGLTVGTLSGKLGGVTGEVKLGPTGSEEVVATIGGAMAVEGAGGYSIADSSGTGSSLALSRGEVLLCDAALTDLSVGNGTHDATLTTSGPMTVSHILAVGKRGTLIVDSDLLVTGTFVVDEGLCLVKNGGTLTFSNVQLVGEGASLEAYGSTSDVTILDAARDTTLVYNSNGTPMDVTAQADGGYSLEETTPTNGNDVIISTNTAGVTLPDGQVRNLSVAGEVTHSGTNGLTATGQVSLSSGATLDMGGQELLASNAISMANGSALENHTGHIVEDSGIDYEASNGGVTLTKGNSGICTLTGSTPSGSNDLTVFGGNVLLADTALGTLEVLGGTVTMAADASGLDVDLLTGTVGGVTGVVSVGSTGNEVLAATIGGIMDVSCNGDGTCTLTDSSQRDNRLEVNAGSVLLDDTQLASISVNGGSVTMATGAKNLTLGSLSGKVGGVTGEVKLGPPGSEELHASVGGRMEVTGNGGGMYTLSDSAGQPDNTLTVNKGDITLMDDELGALTLTGGSATLADGASALSVGALSVDTSLNMEGKELTLTGSCTIGEYAMIRADVTLGDGVELVDNENVRGAVTVKKGASMKGSGTSHGHVIVENGGHLHIGNSPGYRYFAQGLTLHNNATISFSVDGTTPASAAGNGEGTHSYARITGGALTLGTGDTAIAQVDILGNIITAGYEPFVLTLLEAAPAAVNGNGQFSLSLSGQTDLLLASATSLEWNAANGKLIFRSMLNPGHVAARAHRSGAAIANALWSSTSAVRAFARNATSQLSAPVVAENGVTMWGSAISDYVMMSALRSNAHGYAIGADKQWFPQFRGGLSFGQMFGDYSARHGLAEVKQESIMFGLYGEYSHKLNKRHGISMTGYAAYGRVDNDADTRVLGLAELPGRASWDDDVFVAGFRANWNMSVSAKTTLSPFIGLEYQRGKQASFSEHYAGGSRDEYRGGAMQVWSLPVGLTAATEYDLGGGQKLLPWLTVGYVADIARQNPHLSAGVLGQEYRFEGENPGRHGFMLNTGANWQISESWSAGASYNFETRRHETSHEGNISVRCSF